MASRYLTTRRSVRTRRIRWLAIFLGGLIGLIGYYGPWVPHKAAGLVVIGLDLAEYVKFIPEFASGKIAFRREVFYLPSFAASVGASLLASRRVLPTWSRWLIAFLAIPLALAMLPPAWNPAILLLPEFRLQTAAIACCLMLVPGAMLLRGAPDRPVLIAIAMLSLAAAIAPAWGFVQVHTAIEALYRQPLALGWGFWVGTGGFLTTAFISIAEAMRG
ncbi:MAG: hypothetical protein MUC51_03375 [Anaerolineae bacterium]|nr:hypothetical protein [Anaerolineae bacterium]